MAINTNELLKILAETPASQNLMLVGRHGIGKSEILTRYFQQLGMHVNTLFLGQMSDPGDLIGLPRLDKTTGKTVFMPPYWFPTDGNPIVLFLDELNRASPEVLQTIMDLALNRKLAGRALPDGSRLIAAVNDGEEYQLTDLDPALVSRFNIYTFRPTAQEWLLWASENRLDHRVIDFIRSNPKLLDGDRPADNEDRGLEKSPDRRAWKKVSDCICNTAVLNDIHKKMIAGIVGTIATQAFFTFLAQNRLLSAEEVLLEYPKVKNTLRKYKLHEIALVNESIFRFLEVGEYDKGRKTLIAANLKAYLNDLQKDGKNEETAHFASFFEKDGYPQALAFVLTDAPQIYNRVVNFIRNL
ncbi:MAG: AAA family ATPase [Bacteroidales bacterium]|nr:AAA family ATPase [Bacteroidales bacterium]MDY6348709.1 AAA family ATPase [Bacteroidales bacterium]